MTLLHPFCQYAAHCDILSLKDAEVKEQRALLADFERLKADNVELLATLRDRVLLVCVFAAFTCRLFHECWLCKAKQVQAASHSPTPALCPGRVHEITCRGGGGAHPKYPLLPPLRNAACPCHDAPPTAAPPHHNQQSTAGGTVWGAC